MPFRVATRVRTHTHGSRARPGPPGPACERLTAAPPRPPLQAAGRRAERRRRMPVPRWSLQPTRLAQPRQAGGAGTAGAGNCKRGPAAERLGGQGQAHRPPAGRVARGGQLSAPRPSPPFVGSRSWLVGGPRRSRTPPGVSVAAAAGTAPFVARIRAGTDTDALRRGRAEAQWASMGRGSSRAGSDMSEETRT